MSHVVFIHFFLLYLIEIEMKESTLNIRPLRPPIRNPIRVNITLNTFQNLHVFYIVSSCGDCKCGLQVTDIFGKCAGNVEPDDFSSQSANHLKMRCVLLIFFGK